MAKLTYLEPAKSIIATMGGIDKVAEITGTDKSRVYRWMYPKANGGTDGLIPQPAATKLLHTARALNIPLDAAAFFGEAA